MGEVYRAHDARLGRDVAVKVLPAIYTAHAERLRRLEREAKLLATLNHPHIAAIYGFEETDAIRALILELVEGETLADHIRRGAMRVDEALRVARQIADALDGAHRRGIIHRDLKPANIKITADGVVKVLDFGLAKELAEESNRSVFRSAEDTIVGTASYMSPEQARGDQSDARTDIWAFGCVLYEMFTGIRAFPGDSFADVVTNILSKDPDFGALPDTVPASIRKLLVRTFAKDRQFRLSSIADARLEIDDVLSDVRRPSDVIRQESHAPEPRRVPYERIAWAILVALLLVAWFASFGVWKAPNGETVRIPITYPANTYSPALRSSHPMISPDGRRVAFRVGTSSGDVIAVRSIDEIEARIVPGTSGVLEHFWSPDSRFLALVADKLTVLDLNRGEARTIADTDRVYGGAWGTDGTIVLGTDREGLRRISVETGLSAPLTRVDPAGPDKYHASPSFLPDGRHVLFVAMPSATLYVTSLDGSMPKKLLSDVGVAHYSPPGYLLYDRDGVLFAQPFDMSGLELTGTAFSIVSGEIRVARGDFSVSSQGSLAYKIDGGNQKQFQWVDRSGRVLEKIEPAGDYFYFDLSNNDQDLVASERDEGRQILLVRDLARRDAQRRLSLQSISDTDPRWSPDGQFVAFASNRQGSKEIMLWEKLTGRTRSVFAEVDANYSLDDWAPDGSMLIIHRDSDAQVLTLPIRDKVAPARLVLAQRGKVIDHVEFSPDGRWIAFNSDEMGVDHIFVTRYPAGSERWQISTSGGRQPRWRKDGRELFYLSLDGALMSVTVDPTGEFRAGPPNRLFHTELPVVSRGVGQYDVTQDGQRFLLLKPAPGLPSRITVVLNWLSQFARN